jgi:hypothetical protein
VDPSHRLANELRRVIESLQVTDLEPEESADLADRVRTIADDLQEREHRSSLHQVPDVGLDVVFTPNPNPGPSPGWTEAEVRSPIRGVLNAVAPPLTIQVVDTDEGKRLRGEVCLSATYEGAPNTVHGGIVSALMDEMLGNAQRVAQIAGYTGTLTVRFRAPTPTYTPLVAEAWLDRIEGRKIFMIGTLHAGDVLCAEAEGIFIAPRV